MPFTSENATLTTASVALDMLTGREYLRVSQDSSGHQRSVTEQHDDKRTTARHSIVITGAPYVDNDRSASRYASKARDDWARLVADLESGAFTEDVLILWENSQPVQPQDVCVASPHGTVRGAREKDLHHL